MAAVETIQIPLGFMAPEFTLLDTITYNRYSLSELKGEKATVILFICNHCPYVIHIQEEIIQIANKYIPQGISFIAISSNDIIQYPDDGPELMHKIAIEKGYPFPYLYDESQEIAKAYMAACTPDISVFDHNMLCVYRGQLDDSRPKNDSIPDGKDLRAVLDAIINGTAISTHQKPSIGCSIKWKK